MYDELFMPAPGAPHPVTEHVGACGVAGCLCQAFDQINDHVCRCGHFWPDHANQLISGV